MLDFLIIGGGIAGLSAAAHVSRLGQVMLVEGEQTLGYHSSGRSAALYEAEYGAVATVAVARASERALQDMGVLSPRGLLVVGQAGDRLAFEADIEALKLTPITPAEAVALFPILNPARLHFAAYTDSARNIDTDRMMQTYARAMRSNGGIIRTNARVDGIERVASGWRVRLGGDIIDAARIINAAGSWADTVARMAGLPPIGINAFRRTLAQIPIPRSHDDGLESSAWPMAVGAGETWYAKPEAGKLLVSPADEDLTEPHDAYPDDWVLAEGLARYEDMMIAPVTRVETAWAGLRSFAPDRSLVLGPDPIDPAFVWCAGQGGQGFLSAPGAAQVLGETLGGETSGQPMAVLRALSPARFRE